MSSIFKLPITVNKKNGQYNTYFLKSKLSKELKEKAPKSIKIKITDIEW